MEFSEANLGWQLVPRWAGFLIRFGYDWPRGGAGNRRIALVSMPCDSAAAGLVALGAMVRDLCDPHANDIDGHYDGLLRYARQYLESCRNCELETCDPALKRCGHHRKSSGVVRSPRFPHKPHIISDRTDVSQRRLAFDDRKGTYWPNPQYLTDWHVDGDPPPQWGNAEGELPAGRYLQLVQGAPFHPDNLRKSYSGLCLAGRTGGGNASREMCASVRFRDGIEQHGLEELLTVQGWSACSVSRVAFFNARTEEVDRNAAAPYLVIADGDCSFLNVVDRPEFRESDVVGAIHRIMERDRLEALGNKMSALRQWYVQDEDMLYGLPGVPRGMSISILRRRP